MIVHIDCHALKAISTLQRPGKPDLLKRVVDLYQSESPKAIACIQAGIEELDLSSVRNSAHSLKSSSAYVGAKLVSQCCRDLELAAREENYAACVAISDGLDELFAASCSALATYMATEA